MTHRRLTPRPAVPVLVQAAALGTLFAAGGCASLKSSRKDIAPTDVCSHDPGSCEEVDDRDVHPTDPCAHDPSQCPQPDEEPGPQPDKPPESDAATPAEPGG